MDSAQPTHIGEHGAAVHPALISFLHSAPAHRRQNQRRKPRRLRSSIRKLLKTTA